MPRLLSVTSTAELLKVKLLKCPRLLLSMCMRLFMQPYLATTRDFHEPTNIRKRRKPCPRRVAGQPVITASGLPALDWLITSDLFNELGNEVAALTARCAFCLVIFRSRAALAHFILSFQAQKSFAVRLRLCWSRRDKHRLFQSLRGYILNAY